MRSVLCARGYTVCVIPKTLPLDVLNNDSDETMPDLVPADDMKVAADDIVKATKVEVKAGEGLSNSHACHIGQIMSSLGMLPQLCRKDVCCSPCFVSQILSCFHMTSPGVSCHHIKLHGYGLSLWAGMSPCLHDLLCPLASIMLHVEMFVVIRSVVSHTLVSSPLIVSMLVQKSNGH